MDDIVAIVGWIHLNVVCRKKKNEDMKYLLNKWNSVYDNVMDIPLVVYPI